MKKQWLFLVITICYVSLELVSLARATIINSKYEQQQSINLKEMVDPTISPCNDFFHYVCNNWKMINPIPDDQSRWGQFSILREINLIKLRILLEEIDSNTMFLENKMIGDFYAACMNEEDIEIRGTNSLNFLLSKIDALINKQDLVPLLATLHRFGISVFFAFGSTRDPIATDQYIAGIDQDGLGLPDRDFYFRDDKKTVHQRKAYKKHISKMLILAGDSIQTAKLRAKAILALESNLAEISLDLVTRRDPQRVNNPISFSKFITMAPGIDWIKYVHSIKAPTFNRINNQSIDYFGKVGAVIAMSHLDDIKSYLRWHTLHASTQLLPKSFVEENFNFYEQILAGTPNLQPRWKQCVKMTDRSLGENLGRLFVNKYYPSTTKDRMIDLVSNIHQSFSQMISDVDWMSSKTKAKALDKLKLMRLKIGHPEKWIDYSTIKINRNDAMSNFLNTSSFEVMRDINKIGTIVDHNEWEMTPPTVNAYYDSKDNSINFPAGILQFPFFEKDADEALNFGAIGTIIGHEITHGFDDHGRQYDGNGNLNDWWTTIDDEKFKTKTQCLVDEYESFVIDNNIKLNGILTLGENIADNGGVRIAYMALKKYLSNNTESATKIDDWTPEQKFFLGMARTWCSSERHEARQLQIQTDPHSLAQYRVNGVVSNLPEFANAFSCKPNDAMIRQNSCKVW